MEVVFRRAFWAGLVACIGLFFYAIIEPSASLIWLFIASYATGLSALGWLVFQLWDAQAAKKLAVDSESAFRASATLGKDVAGKTASSVLPRLIWLFSFEGRVGRRAYLVCQVVLAFLLFVFATIVLISESETLSGIALLLTGALIVSLVSLGVRRTRDTGVNQWWYLLILVPPVNLALQVFLLLVPTDEFEGRGL